MLGQGALGQFALGQPSNPYLVAVGTATATSSASAVGTAIKPAIGTAAATSSASGVGRSFALATGTANASSTVLAAGLSHAVATGTAAAVSAASAVGTGIRTGVGTAVAVSSAFGIGGSIAIGRGTSHATSFARAFSATPLPVARQFFFAYVGGQTDPAFSLTTTGDIWGGSLQILATTWGGSLTTSGDVLIGEFVVINMLKDDGLIIGNQYIISGDGIATQDEDGNLVSVQFTYDGDLSGNMVESATKTTLGASLLLVNEDGKRTVFLTGDQSLLVSGRVYGISGGGIPSGTTFTYAGDSQITISQDCSTTSSNSVLTITSLLDKTIVKNLSSVSGLVNGQIYNVFGQGVPAGTISTYEGGSSLTLSNSASVSFHGAILQISKGVTYSDGGDFDPNVHNVEDEKIFNVELTQDEGDFASLTIEIAKPAVAPLSPTRKFWAWFSMDIGTEIKPLFHGRIVGMPEDSSRETVKLKFIAKPEDFDIQKITLANTLKVPPNYDPVWLAENADKPDAVLTARPELWDIDRVSLVVRTTNIITGEDGVIDIGETQTLYENYSQSYLSTPIRRVNVNATVSWDQVGEGEVDITKKLYDAFASAGSGMGFPVISTFTGDGLKSTWPKNLASFGDAWSLDNSSSLIDATWARTGQYAVKYKQKDVSTQVTQTKISGKTSPITILGNPQVPPLTVQTATPEVTYDVLFDLSIFSFNFVLRYDVSRSRSENISFSLEADVQPVMFEPGAEQQEQIDLHSDFISAPIDNDGAVPLIDLRSNSYFKTDRGQQSVEYLILLAYCRLLMKARCVSIKFNTDWISLIDISCRKNINYTDRRVVGGGSAIGKVTSYTFTGDGDSGEFIASATIGCTVGNGNELIVTEGVPSYVADGYMDDGYQKETGGQIELVAGSVAYQNFDDLVITDDDGLDLFNMTPENCVVSVAVSGGRAAQREAIDQAVAGKSNAGDPVSALAQTPTRVRLDLIAVSGGSFSSNYNLIVSPISVPKTIDLGVG